MRIGIIGYGAVAAVHVKGLHQWGADLRTIFGPDPERARAFAHAHRVLNSTTTLEDLLDQCDAAIVASPSGRHFEQAQAVLCAGRHCLVELPACSSAAEARTLCALASSSSAEVHCNVRIQPGTCPGFAGWSTGRRAVSLETYATSSACEPYRLDAGAGSMTPSCITQHTTSIFCCTGSEM